MTWEELSRRYESDNPRRTGDKPAVKGKPWQEIMRSTDKLVWLFLVTGSGKGRAVNTN